MAFLKENKHIQDQVDSRIRELSHLGDKGNYKSQRGGTDTVWVKTQVPWPQNKILTGTGKNRVSYDSLSVFHWVSGFSAIVRDESDMSTKTQMLDYLCELMDDAQDFG